MRETNFIKQNEDKWKAFEQTLDSQTRDPEKMNDVFIQVTDDLSYARTFYPHRSVRVYLNGVAQRIFFTIYKGKKAKRRLFFEFWKTELPQLVYESRQEFRLSLGLFVLAMLVGIVSSYMDAEFVRSIMGDAYVDMTLSNIESGDPMAVYKDKDEGGMFAYITANNLRVALLTFMMGALFAIGTVAIMLKNGVMVGAFQWFFVEQGLFKESFLTIWTHGTLEISAIIIAGAAGLTMGRGLILPGTLSRLKSFQLSARRGLKIMIGITPIIIAAGFIEGFFTRYTDAPDLVRLLFIVACLVFVLFYFVYYPWAIAEREVQSDLEHARLSPDVTPTIRYASIRSNGSIFTDVFVLFGHYFRKFSVIAARAMVIYAVLIFSIAANQPTEMFYFTSSMASTAAGAIDVVLSVLQVFGGALAGLSQFFFNENNTALFLTTNTLLFAAIALQVALLMRTEAAMESELPAYSRQQLAVRYAHLLLPSLGLAGYLYYSAWHTYFFGIFVLPFLMLWMYIIVIEEKNAILALGKTFLLYFSSYWKVISLSLTFTLLGMLVFMLLDSVVLWFVFDFVGMNLHFQQETMDQLAIVFLTMQTMFFVYLIFQVLFLSNANLYHSLLEKHTALGLHRRIQEIGQNRRIQGMMRE